MSRKLTVHDLVQNKIPFALGVSYITVPFIKDYQKKEYFILFEKRHKKKLEGIKYSTLTDQRKTQIFFPKIQMHEITEHQLLEYIEYYDLQLIIRNDWGHIYEHIDLGLRSSLKKTA